MDLSDRLCDSTLYLCGWSPVASTASSYRHLWSLSTSDNAGLPWPSIKKNSLTSHNMAAACPLFFSDRVGNIITPPHQPFLKKYSLSFAIRHYILTNITSTDFSGNKWHQFCIHSTTIDTKGILKVTDRKQWAISLTCTECLRCKQFTVNANLSWIFYNDVHYHNRAFQWCDISNYSTGRLLGLQLLPPAGQKSIDSLHTGNSDIQGKSQCPLES